MADRLKKDREKIPSTDRYDLMHLFAQSWSAVRSTLDNVSVFKKNGITIKLDGSEDDLVSRKIWDLVKDEMVPFREALLHSAGTTNMKKLHSMMIPPEGVRRKSDPAETVMEDEGEELLDGEFILPEQIQLDNEEVGSDESDNESDTEPDTAQPSTSSAADSPPDAQPSTSSTPAPDKPDEHAIDMKALDKLQEFLNELTGSTSITFSHSSLATTTSLQLPGASAGSALYMTETCVSSWQRNLSVPELKMMEMQMMTEMPFT